MGLTVSKDTQRQEDQDAAVPVLQPEEEAGPEDANFDWQSILWREWRNSREFDWSDQSRDRIFGLVADLPVRKPIVSAITGLLTGIYGGAIGWVWQSVGDHWVNGTSDWDTGQGVSLKALFDLTQLWFFPVICSIAGALLGWASILCFGGRLTWREWLTRFVPNRPAPMLADQVLNVFTGGFLRGPLAALLLCGVLLRSAPVSVFESFGASHFVLVPLVVCFCIACYFDLKALLEGSPWPNGYPLWCFWWRRRPQPQQVERALRTVCGAEWKSVLRLIDEKMLNREPIRRHIESICSSSWKRRIASAHALLALGGEAVDSLAALANHEDRRVQRVAHWILGGIEKDTRSRLKDNRKWLCPHCFVRLHKHVVPLSTVRHTSFYGCRECGETRRGLECARVHAVLDCRSTWEFVLRNQCARINWPKRRTLFDFDRVDIESADDLVVEQFVVAVGNDADEIRRQRYKQITCHLSRDCRLSENTLRILKDTFAHVLYHA